MSNIVAQIRTGLESCIKNTLGASWKELDNKFDLKKNNFENQTKRFGVVVRGGDQSPMQMTTFVTVARTFDITILNQYISTINKDSNVQAAIDILENAMDEIIKAASLSKCNQPNLVLTAVMSSIADPDFDSLENVLIYNFSLTVNYRSALVTCP